MIPPYQVTLDYTFHWRPVFNKLPNLLEAGLETLKVAVIAMIFGIIIGLILNYLKQSKWFIYRWFSISWIEIARNTPALLQLFFFGFGLGAFGLHLDPLLIILLGLSFNNFSLKNIFNFDTYKPLPMGDGQNLSLRLQASQFFNTYSFSLLNLGWVPRTGAILQLIIPYGSIPL